MARGFDNIDPNANQKGDNLKPEEIFDIFKLTECTSYTSFRLLPGDMLPVKMHWIKIRAGKDKRETKIPKLCVSFDPDNERVPLEGTDCPYCKLSGGQDGSQQTNLAYFANAIVRDIQEDEPRKKAKLTKEEKKTGFKDVKSKSWTPVRVIRLPSGLAGKIKEMKERNGGYAVTDPDNGIDVDIKFDDSRSGADKYQIDRGEKAPLEDDELEYLTYDLGDHCFDLLGRETQEQAEKEFARMDIIGHDQIEDDEEDDDDDDDLPRKSKSKGKKSRKRGRDEEDEEEDEDEEDEDEEDSRSRRRKSGSKRSRRSSIDDDDDEDEEDDEDDSPRSRRKKSKKKTSSRRRSSVDEDDEDDDDDEEDSRSSRRKKSKKKTSSRKRSRDDDDDDDDEDDVPRRRKSGAKKKTGSRRRRG